MDTFKQLELQRDIKNSTEEMRNTINDLYKWEREVKEMEKERTKSCESEKYPPIRSHINKQDNNNNSKTTKEETVVNKMVNEKLEKSDSTIVSKQDLANSHKDKGNDHVKRGEYEKAVNFYTEAITCFAKDPIFYTNRALCYLKLKSYNECIEDCTKAISLNSKSLKAYYRRMQAKECLGLHKEALMDCKKVLEIDPKNPDANKSIQRLNNILNIADPNKFISNIIPNEPTWTKIEGDTKNIIPISKPPHLRSKKTIKRVKIDEFIGKASQKEYKNNENSNIASNINISDEIIEKMFNSDVGGYVEIKKDQKKISAPEIKTEKRVKLTSPESNEKILDSVKSETEVKPILPQITIRKIEKVPPAPKSTGQFYATWKDLSNEQKYEYFKSIEITNINKILGTSIGSEILSDILNVLSTNFITDNNLNLTKILLEISKHKEMAILSFFLSSADLEAFRKIFSHVKNSEEDVAIIKKNFGISD